MIGQMIYSIFTSTIVMAVLGGVAAAGTIGSWLNLIPPPWGGVASLAGKGAMIAVVFIFGCRFADERHEMASLKNHLEITKTDLKNEQEARKVDLTVIKELADEKQAAERTTDDLRQYVEKLSEQNRCIATPDILKRLHKPR